MKPSFIGLATYAVFLYFQPADFFPDLAVLRPAYSVGVLTLVLALLEKSGRGGLRLPRGKQTALLLAFYAVGVFSTFQGISWEASTYALAELSKMVGLYFLILLVLDSEALLARFAALLVALTTIQALTSMWIYYGDKTASVRSRLRMVSYFRGMAGDPNDFSLLLVMIIPFALAFLEFRRSPVGKAYYLTAFMAFLYSITRSGSRGGFLGLAAVLGQVLWAKRRRPAIILAALAVAGVVFVKTPASYWDRIATITDSAAADGSIHYRRRAAEMGLEFVRQSPVLGIGIGNFVTTWRWSQPEADRVYVAHSSVIQVAAEMGLAGLAFYLGIILVAWRSAFSAERRFAASGQRELFGIARATRIGLVAFVFTSLFLSQQFHRIFYILVAFSLLLLEFAKRGEALEPEAQEARIEASLVSSGGRA